VFPDVSRLRSRLHVIISLWVALTRQSAPLNRSRTARGDVSDRLIAAVIYLGMVEQRRMTASRIARDAGLPRPTVLRRLAALERDGAVERHGLTWRTPLPVLMKMEAANLEPLVRLIRAHAAELERLGDILSKS
jgi:CRP-like cAMP-binding protein